MDDTSPNHAKHGADLFSIFVTSFCAAICVAGGFGIVFQAFINMSVALGLGPTKGIPLPLISYGGSSLLSTMVSLGLLLSVSERAR